MHDHSPAGVARPPPRGRPFPSEAARLRSFADAIDAIHRRARARVGPRDLQAVRRIDRFSRRCGVLGRVLLQLGPGPLSFAAGVGLLWVYKQLQMAEIGHTVLHGAYNGIDGAGRYRSGDFVWRVPIDERSWMTGHNGKHHGLTNIRAGDPDIDYGFARLTRDVPHRPCHYVQVPVMLLTFPVFSVAMNVHFTGALGGEDRGPSDRRRRVGRFLRKVVPYFAKEFGLFPLLAGPRFGRVLVGNLLTEGMRDVYTACAVYCGHVGADVASFPAGTRARSKGERYAMQVSASNDFSVSWPVSVLCGGLDRQIEHHLFPTLAPHRLREVSAEVRRACTSHGVPYRDASWPATLWRAVAHMLRLSFASSPTQPRLAPTQG